MKCPQCSHDPLRVITIMGTPDGGDDTRPVICPECLTMFLMEFGQNPRYGKNVLRPRSGSSSFVDAHRDLGGDDEELREDIRSEYPTVEDFRASRTA